MIEMLNENGILNFNKQEIEIAMDEIVLLEKLQGFSFDASYFAHTKLQIPFEQLCCYFLFRHLAGALCDNGFAQRIKVCLAGCYMIGALCQMHQAEYGEVGVGEMAEYARMYSAEIEYSDENLDFLLDNL